MHLAIRMHLSHTVASGSSFDAPSSTQTLSSQMQP
jgi:hypothetical protein